MLGFGKVVKDLGVQSMWMKPVLIKTIWDAWRTGGRDVDLNILDFEGPMKKMEEMMEKEWRKNNV